MINTKTPIIETMLYKEIHEQPVVLSRFIKEETQIIEDLAAHINQKNIDHIFIAARGTSDNVARYAKYVFGTKNRMVVSLAAPSLFSIFNQPPNLKNSLVLGISQSGQSPDIVSVLSEAKKQGALTAVITNTPKSPLAEQGDFVIDLNAGEEKALAATKTYTSQLTAISMISSYLSKDPVMVSEIEEIPIAVSESLKMKDHISKITERFRFMDSCVVISRGYNYATGYELALKLKELTFIKVEPYSSADFLHGPIAILEQGYPVFLIAPHGKMLPVMKSFVDLLHSRKAELIAISDDDEFLSLTQIPLKLTYRTPEWLSPISTIVPGQLFALYLAHIRGYDVDSSRGLTKVTETL